MPTTTSKTTPHSAENHRRDRATTRNCRPKLIPKLNQPKLSNRPFSVGPIASLSTQNDEHAASDLRQRVGGIETAETRTAAKRRPGDQTMARRDAIPRKPTRILTAGEIEREIAGIRVGLEMGGVPFTAKAEAAARAVLNGEITGDEAIACGLAELNARTAQ